MATSTKPTPVPTPAPEPVADPRRVLADQIVTMVKTSFPDMAWPDVDGALGIASHEIKLAAQG